METLVKFEEIPLLNYLTNQLKRYYSTIDRDKNNNYVYAAGDIPILLVAHVDTVFETPPDELFYDKRKQVIFTPFGAGFDDRAGVFAILKILHKGYKPHILFTNGEELGGIGVKAFLENYPKNEHINYVIQLDRSGYCDCVFYQCDNPDFTKYISSFGFVEDSGSFTDISFICPMWKIAGVNLSVGYLNEHSASEILYVRPLFATIEKVCHLLDEVTIPRFEYIARRRIVTCDKCGRSFSDKQSYFVASKNCIVKTLCGSCFVKSKLSVCDKYHIYCENKCKEELFNGTR
jgi:hypothetical protein